MQQNLCGGLQNLKIDKTKTNLDGCCESKYNIYNCMICNIKMTE